MTIIIPAKFGSRRTPQKNFKPFYKDLSLLQIAALRSASVSANIIINSEAPDEVEIQIMRLSPDVQSKIQIVERAEHLREDPATIVDVLKHTVSTHIFNKIPSITCVLPTSPFSSAKEIQKAQKLFKNACSDRLISVSESVKPPFNSWFMSSDLTLSSVFPESDFAYTKSTECPTTYLSNGCISIYRTEALYNYEVNSMKTVGYEMGRISSIDIDYPHEFDAAKALFASCASDLDFLDVQ